MFSLVLCLCMCRYSCVFVCLCSCMPVSVRCLYSCIPVYVFKISTFFLCPQVAKPLSDKAAYRASCSAAWQAALSGSCKLCHRRWGKTGYLLHATLHQEFTCSFLMRHRRRYIFYFSPCMGKAILNESCIQRCMTRCMQVCPKVVLVTWF